MNKYLKLFDTHSNYETYIGGQNKLLPNVSYCEDNNEVHYNPFVPSIPNNVIIYEASNILPVGAAAVYGPPQAGYNPNAFGTTIISHTFENGKGIFTFEDDITAIAGSNSWPAFFNCNFTSITIPTSVTSIGESCFYYCTGLASVTIPDSVTSIGNNAFNGCSSLTSVTIEATTPPTLGTGAFTSNASGRKIYVPSASVSAYQSASGWSNYASDIETIPS